MKVLVPVKRVIDAFVPIRVKSDESGVETRNIKKSMNPFCEIALEQAVRMKEAGEANEVIAVTIGLQETQEVLRNALAIGADRAIHVLIDEEEIQPLAVAKLLKTIIEKENPMLVIMGKQAIDNDHNQTGQMLAGLLNWSQATFVSKMQLKGTDLEAVREIDSGLQTLLLALPAIVTVDLRLNKPRYAKLPDIMKAKRKPIDVISPEDLQVNIASRFDVLKVTEPAKRIAGEMLKSVDELIIKLKDKGVLL